MRLSRLISLIFALLLLVAWPAQAHTSLISSDPADGARLDALPDRIVLTFTENLRQPSEAGLLRDGQALEADVQVDGPRLVVTPTATGDGTYTVNYRVVSADGHPVTGTIEFAVGDAAAAAEQSASGDSADEGPISWGLAVALAAVLALGGGAAAFIFMRSRSDGPAA